MCLMLKITWRGSAPARAFGGWVADAIGVKIRSAAVVRESSRKSLQLNMLKSPLDKDIYSVVVQWWFNNKNMLDPYLTMLKTLRSLLPLTEEPPLLLMVKLLSLLLLLLLLLWLVFNLKPLLLFSLAWPARVRKLREESDDSFVFCHNKILLHVTTKQSIVTWE